MLEDNVERRGACLPIRDELAELLAATMGELALCQAVLYKLNALKEVGFPDALAP